MRIGIDARFLGPKQKGLGRYVQKLVENVVDSGDFEFVIFLRKKNFDEFNSAAKNVKKVLADWRWYTLAEQVFMPFIIWKERVDLMHFPHFNVPIFCPSKFVVTIHDLVLKRFPTKRTTTLNPVIYKIKESGYRLVLNSAIKKSKKIIAPSNFTKQEILEHFKIDSSKIDVIYEGVPVAEASGVEEGVGREFLGKYGISKHYILYVGNAYPHKNLDGLIAAFSKIIKEYKLDFQLVLVGEIDYFYERLKGLILKKFNDLSAKKMIVFSNFVSEKELPIFYKNASLYISPAFFEGFGLPALEAMSYGVPVVSSGEGAQPEILGDAVLYFNPDNVGDMAEKMSVLLKNENIKERMVKTGFDMAKRYNWKKMAEETIKIYKIILGGKSLDNNF